MPVSFYFIFFIHATLYYASAPTSCYFCSVDSVRLQLTVTMSANGTLHMISLHILYRAVSYILSTEENYYMIMRHVSSAKTEMQTLRLTCSLFGCITWRQMEKLHLLVFREFVSPMSEFYFRKQFPSMSEG